MAKGLSAESITVAAAELIEQYGRSGFSMRLLADTMGVKTASLYNHIENMDTLLTEVCRYALRMQEDGELRAIAGKTGREAVWALAWAYRRFAQQHRELYWLVMDTAVGEPRVLDDAAARFTEPLKQVLSGFRLPPREEIHFRRMFRFGLRHLLQQCRPQTDIQDVDPKLNGTKRRPRPSRFHHPANHGLRILIRYHGRFDVFPIGV